ncbi:hypothetical protein M0805_005980 [Coniferiporia weirii]|nr:hypothetical protein M0805_005980 [Coniferiporia weirii]
MPYSKALPPHPQYLVPPSYLPTPPPSTRPSYYQVDSPQPGLSSTTVATEEISEYSNEDAEALFSGFRRVPSEGIQPLAVPLCIPQTTPGATTLFTRAYSPELQASGIEMDDWIKFIDALNLAHTASPPLRVVDMAGMVIGLVPYHWAMIASTCLQVVAKTGIHIISKSLTDRLLRRANAEYFAPRGLRVRICKNAAMRQIIGLDAPTPEPHGSEKFTRFKKSAGRTAETVALHLPVVRKIYNHYAEPVPAVDPNAPGEMAARRMLPLQGYVLPLTFDVPPPVPLTGMLDKASELTMRMESWQLHRDQEDKNHMRQVLAYQQGHSTYLPLTPLTSSSDESQNVFERTLEKKREKKWRKQEERAIKGDPSTRLRQGVEVADRLEWNSTDALLWIVVLNADQDAAIMGTEMIDNVENVETVQEEDWQWQMRNEAAERQYYTEQNKFGKAA